MSQPENQAVGSEKAANGSFAAAPSITLPKGGGAIRGIGEKFAANPVTGTGSMSVPIVDILKSNKGGPAKGLSIIERVLSQIQNTKPGFHIGVVDIQGENFIPASGLLGIPSLELAGLPARDLGITITPGLAGHGVGLEVLKLGDFNLHFSIGVSPYSSQVNIFYNGVQSSVGMQGPLGTGMIGIKF